MNVLTPAAIRDETSIRDYRPRLLAMTVFPCFIRRIYPANGDERSMTTMISNPGARGGFVLYRPSSRSSWPSPPLFSFPIVELYYTNTRLTLVHMPCKSEKKKTHTRSWEKIACAGESSFSPISRRVRNIFWDHSRIWSFKDLFTYRLLSDFLRYPIRLRRILHADTVVASIVVEERCCIVIATGRTLFRSSIHSKTMQRKRCFL